MEGRLIKVDPAMRWHPMSTEYPAVRRVMGPTRDRLDDDALEALLVDSFPGAEPEDVEDFMQTLQAFGRQAAPVAQKALPGVIAGATTGAALGPWGALVGGVAGGAASLLSGPSAAPGPAAPPAAAPTPAPAGQAGPAGPPAPASSAPAATAQLLTLLSRPETMQALLALLMSGSGRSTVQVGQRQVPAGAFANAISETAARLAEAAAAPLDEAITEYLFDNGQPRGDVANPVERSAMLLSDLAAVAAEEAAEEQEGDAPAPLPEIWEEQDPLESYEAALLGEVPDEY